MCNQSVGLIAAALEERGIATTAIMLVRSIAEAVRPPRSLVVPFAFGYPLHAPNDVQAQQRVIRAALALLHAPGPPPVLAELD